MENICDVDEINLLTKCENVELLRENENSVIKKCDYEFENKIEGFVSDEPCVKENSLHDICIPLKICNVNNSNYIIMILNFILLLMVGHSFFIFQ